MKICRPTYLLHLFSHSHVFIKENLQVSCRMCRFNVGIVFWILLCIRGVVNMISSVFHHLSTSKILQVSNSFLGSCYLPVSYFSLQSLLTLHYKHTSCRNHVNNHGNNKSAFLELYGTPQGALQSVYPQPIDNWYTVLEHSYTTSNDKYHGKQYYDILYGINSMQHQHREKLCSRRLTNTYQDYHVHCLYWVQHKRNV